MNHNNITGILLAGGKSSRMGTDKGMINFNGKTFVQHIIDAMQPLVSDVFIVSDNKEYDKLGYLRVDDSIKNSGPLAGLYAGLKYTKTDYNLVLSCDIPLIDTEILKVLTRSDYTNYDVVQIQSGEKTMPLIALYHKRCANKCLELIQNDERRLRKAVNQLHTKSIVIDFLWKERIKNINTKEDLKDINYAIKH
ncbi:molybdenum cofactor guanylyltransferase [Hanstruepera marina]|uniref:molybdenum cofactor guanylyltransferase n=1 Tax=Hanstruepera marina TaxID=2873265 RepID=UPI001CA769A2|nr:molybdenum cofactor guanylyltransferase [Hanstruepera marina]